MTESDKLQVTVNTSFFSKDAILKCLYWYGEKFLIDIENKSEDNIAIILTPKQPIAEEDKDFYIAKLNKDIIDFNLRDIVTKETKNIRDLLIAKAFSNGEFDEVPPGDISDPVGFSLSINSNGNS